MMKKYGKKLLSSLLVISLIFQLTGCALVPSALKDRVSDVSQTVKSRIMRIFGKEGANKAEDDHVWGGIGTAEKEDSEYESNESTQKTPNESDESFSEENFSEENPSEENLSDESLSVEETPAATDTPAADPYMDQAMLVETILTSSSENGFDTTIRMPYISWYGGDPNISAAINAAFSELTASAIEVAGEWSCEGGFYDFLVTDITVNGYIMSVAFDETIYGGGAHPIHSTFSLNYDLISGSEFDLGSIISGLSDDKKAAFSSLLEEALSVYEYDLFTSPADTAASIIAYGYGAWSCSEEGLTGTFIPGDLAPYASGSTPVTLPAESLSGIIDPRYFAPVKMKGEGTVDIMPMSAATSPHYGTELLNCLGIQGAVTDLKVMKDYTLILYMNYGCDCTIPYPTEDGIPTSITYVSGENVVTINP